MEDEDYEFVPGQEEDRPFANPLYQTPGFAPTPRHAFGPLQSNPVWSPNEPLSQPRQQTFKQDTAPSSLAGTAAVEEEISFAAILQAAQNNELDAAGVVQAYIVALDGHAAELRSEAAQQQPLRGLRSIRLQELVTDLDAEAATWRLLFTLHGIPEMGFPAGAGGPPLHDCGSAQRTSQRIASIVEADPELNRVARVVTWLEALAAEELDREEAAAVRAGGSAVSFSEREGLPLNTSDGLDQRRAPDTVSQLDPDAPTRQGKQWAEADVKDNARITERVWRLVRAGRMAEARELCMRCGQPWRAASLGGSLGPGPTPLGAAAVHAEEAPVAEAQDPMAAEVDLDGTALRAMWRWTCYQAAEQIGDQSGCEAAVYGTLGGNLKRVLPLCKTWHDRLWAQARAWLEAALDKECSPSDPTGEESVSDLVNSASERPDQSAIAAEGTSLLRDQWPYHRIAEQAPGSWPAVQAAIGDAAVPSGQSLTFKERMRFLQWELLLGPEPDNYTRLLLDALPDCLREEATGAAEQQPAQQALVAKVQRFAAHLGLAFVDLGILPEPHDADVPSDLVPLQGKVDELLLRYLGHLLASGQHALIPAYACRLTAGPRRQICCSLLAHLTLEGSPPARQEAYEQLAQWFAAWADQGRGDVELDELDIIVRMVAHKSRWDPLAGPALRARTAGWLWLGPTTLVPAIQHTNALLREFALGGSPSADAALMLLEALPQEFLSLLGSPVRELEDMSWVEPLVQAGQLPEEDLPAVRDGLLQMHAWWMYFSLDRAAREWMRRVMQLDGEEDPSLQQEQGRSLLGSHLTFLSAAPSGLPPVLEFVTPGHHTQEEHELKLWVGPPGEGEEGSAFTTLSHEDATQVGPPGEGEEGSAFTTLSHEDATQTAAQLQQQLQAASSAEDFLKLKAAAVEQGKIGSLIELAAAADSADGLQRAVGLLSLALKGALNGAGTAFQVVNMEGSSFAQAQICKLIAYPAAALSAAQMRLMLVQMGEGLDTGSVLIPLVAGTDRHSGYKGLSPHFAPQELQSLLEFERQTLVAHELQQQQLP